MNLREILTRNLARASATRTAAETFAADLLKSYEDGEVGDGSYTYADDSGAAKRFMVAGNGPTAWIVFVRMGDDLSAHLEYSDSEGSVVVALPDHDVEQLLAVFDSDAEERNSR